MKIETERDRRAKRKQEGNKRAEVEETGRRDMEKKERR